MLQFSIRHLLLGTAYVAIGCAISTIAGLEYFLWFNILPIQIAVVTIASIGAVEYTGHRRRFCVASLIALCGFLAWIFLGHFNVATYNILSLIGLAGTYFAGLFAASAYRAINGMTDANDAGRILTAVTRLLAKILPAANRHKGGG